MSNEVVSLVAKMRAEGVDQVVNGFAQISAAAKKAQEVEKARAAQAKKDARDMQQSYKNSERQYNDSIKQQQQLANQQASAAKKLTTFTKDTIMPMALAATAVSVGFKKVFEIGKQGAQIEATSIKFNKLSNSVGTLGNVFLKELKGATKGTVSDFKLMEQGANLLQLGLAKDSKEAVRLSSVMTALGMDTGELTLALANQSKRRLDQLGLSLTKFNEIEAKLKASGMSGPEVFKEAFLQTAEQTVLTTGNIADTNLGSFLRLSAAVSNYVDFAKVSLAKSLAPVAEDVSKFLVGMKELQTGERVWDLKSMLSGGDWVKQGGVQDQSSLWKLKPQIGKGKGAPGAGSGVQIGLSALQNYTAMAFAYGGTGGPQKAEVTPPDYAAILEGGLQLTQMNEKMVEAQKKVGDEFMYTTNFAEMYRNELDILKNAYKNGAISSDELKQKSQELSDSYKDGSYAINKQKEAQDELAAAQEKAYQDYALQLMAKKELDAKSMMDFSLATGQMTQAAYNQQAAQMKIIDAIADGKVTAAAYANELSAIMSKVSKMDGTYADMYINIWIKEHMEGGGGGNLVAPLTTGGGAGSTGEGAGSAGGTLLQSIWKGGQLNGQWSLVGDRPGGVFVPGITELVSPTGYVYDSKTAQKMLESGLISKPTSMAVSGDLLGGGSGSYPVPTPTPTPSNVSTSTSSSSSLVKSSIVGGGSTYENIINALSSTVSEPVINAVTAQQTDISFMQAMVSQQTQAQIKTNNLLSEKLDELLMIMTSDNPRAIGRSVGHEFAKVMTN